jgi:CHAT domain-containing protein
MQYGQLFTNNKKVVKYFDTSLLLRPLYFLYLAIFWFAMSGHTCSQCLTHIQFWDSLIHIENSNFSQEIKLQHLGSLSAQYEKCGYEKDSVYARMLHKTGLWEYSALSHIEDAITNTIAAVRINTSGKKYACPSFAANSYSNLGYYYLQIKRYREALLYYDSAIIASLPFPGNKEFSILSHLQKGNILFNIGDYQQDVEETTLGLALAEPISDTENIIDLHNERAEAYEMLQKYEEASQDIDKSFKLLQHSNNYDALANSYRVKANINADEGNFSKAQFFYDQAISLRKKTGNLANVAMDYNDAGLLLHFKCRNIAEADKYYSKAYELASLAKANLVCILACSNLAQVNFNQKQYSKAIVKTQQALLLLVNQFHSNDVSQNPKYSDISYLDVKNYLVNLLHNKAECLLYLYKQTQDKQYLVSSIATATLADSIITDLRHEQSGDQSKLYWRNATRQFYANSIEACYLANNPQLAFYFMEKSRAVLLNDKLNELGAASKLPASEAAKEEKLQINIIEQQQKLLSLSEGSPEYAAQQVNFLSGKDDLEHYVKSLEQKYPNYYRYKYADEVPTLKDLQNYLAKNNQSFVHYFIGDTVTYILAITDRNTRFIRLSKNEFDNNQLAKFLEFCSDKNLLNSHYDLFATLSNSIYKSLFLPLQIPKGPVTICLDNLVIPFEALCTDASGKNFLLNDYSFSYVYAARNLMEGRDLNNDATGNFLGIAPVSFSSDLNEADLTNSSAAISDCAKYYSINHILIGKDANRKNFFAQMPGYSIVNIFSHAVADSTEVEPKLFLQDSVIHLSELQLIQRPATELVVLSACQTNLGKNATGEGIYSLARGFTAAGIPSVAATLWNADEYSIYSITESFNHNLSQGMNKDEALRQAKLSYLKNNSNEKLPYFWANMIIVGNADPVKLVPKENWWLILTALLLIIALAIMLKKISSKSNIA